ncbi:TPX2 (targeting protein for Xklp2) proteinfamily, partial [Striga asiatica]
MICRRFALIPSMMDADNIIPVSGNGSLENGHHQQVPISENVNGTSNGNLEIEGLAENFENSIELNVEDKLNSGQEFVEEPTLPPGSHSTSNSKDSGVQKPDESKNLKAQDSMIRIDNRKHLSKGKDGKEVKKSSNGNIASESRPRQTSAFGTKSKSFNERQSADSSRAASAKTAQPEEIPKKTKLKALTKGPASKADEIPQSSSNPTAEEAKPLKMGSLPAYNFSFKCNERAEKRKEFYSKLEEKIQAKEEEKSNLQAKTKETQEAEIKKLRKSLGFKATPMPSFYQEPPPPKAELKKIPTTRAKSPKLGRKKNLSSPTADTKENGPCQPRLSLDEKLSQSNLARTTTRDNHVKKPQRKSLPKLPFEDNALSYEKKKTPSSRKNNASKETVEHEVQPKVSTDEETTAAGTFEGQLDVNEKLPEAGEEIAKVQEAIAISFRFIRRSVFHTAGGTNAPFEYESYFFISFGVNLDVLLEKSDVMDADNVIVVSVNEDLENGSMNLNGTSNDTLEIEGLGKNFEIAVGLNEGENRLNAVQEITENPALPPESHSASSPKEPKVQKSDDSKGSKPLKGTIKTRNEKPLSKGKDGKEVTKSLNGNTVSESLPRQTSAFGAKSKSFNERRSSAQNMGPRENKAKLKAIRKGAASKTDEIPQSSSSPTGCDDAKPLKLGTLPTYNFSFKCNERAEKRKEFYSKLEEKIQAKEAEKSNLLAKTKETQNAEIKMFRKSLGFKATPMPSFYQEPAPPKAELKKSPKLGRKKSSSSPTSDTKENGPRPSRAHDHVKKPQRKSLPKLPFEDNALSYEKKKSSSSSRKTAEHEVQPKVLTDEATTVAGGIDSESNVDEKLPEAQEEVAKVQETIP